MKKVKHPNFCIQCESSDLTAENFEDQGYSASRKVLCHNCGKTQIEIWELVSIDKEEKDND